MLRATLAFLGLLVAALVGSQVALPRIAEPRISHDLAATGEGRARARGEGGAGAVPGPAFGPRRRARDRARGPAGRARVADRVPRLGGSGDRRRVDAGG